MNNPSILITGLGSASALGADTETLWRGLLAGQSGLSTMDRFAVQAGQCRVAAQVSTPMHQALHPLQPEPRAMQLGLHAAAEAMPRTAPSGDPDRLGVVIGSGVGMADLVEDLCSRSASRTPTSPVAAFRGFSHSLTCELVRRSDARGPVATVSSGCNSGLDAIGLAVDWIRLGKADRVLAGGAEAEITPSFWAAMSAARALSTRFNDRPSIASRPFDVDRGGNIAGEGAACMVLEREDERDHLTQPRPIARILGWAALGSGTRPPYDPFHPVADPTPMVRAMRAALRDANIAPSDIGGISANGSASVFYDPLECEAIRLLFGDDAPPVFSIKGGLGQTGAVTPALSVTTAALACRDGLLPPTVNCDRPDPACAVDIVRGAPRPIPSGKAILCNAIGFGGQYYASMVIAAVP
jgi:3-oxoacyl-[acyl-carrier-protein] synthase II